jgi:hypothetical protein
MARWRLSLTRRLTWWLLLWVWESVGGGVRGVLAMMQSIVGLGAKTREMMEGN